MFVLEKNEVDAAARDGTLDETVDHITDNIRSSFSEIIDNSILNGASGTQISQLERSRDLEILKIDNYALSLAKTSLDSAKQDEAVAQANVDEFHTNTIGYLSKSTNAEDRKLAIELSKTTNSTSF